MRRKIQFHKLGMFLTALGIIFSIAIPAEATVAPEDVSNPVRNEDTHVDGSTHETVYDYVYFGMYPQREITGDELTDEIRNATYNGNCDAVVDGKKYRRLSYNMIHNVGTQNPTDKKVVWDPYSTDGYRYFLYEPIKWKVLNNENGKLFLWSDNVLDYRLVDRFTSEDTWETSAIREWLNYEENVSEDAKKTHNGAPGFYISAFDISEKNRILVTDVIQDANPITLRKNGNDTQDKVFFLSLTEATNEKYGFCKTMVREGKYQCGTGWITGRSQYAAIQDGIEAEPGGNYVSTSYWLRTDGEARASMIAIGPRTKQTIIQETWFNRSYNMSNVGVVPAIRVEYRLSECIRVSFQTNGAGIIEDQILLGEGYPQEPTNTIGRKDIGMEAKLELKREGFVFNGWYTDSACTKPYNFDRKLTQDTTLYAGWKKKQTAPTSITGGIMKIQGTTSAMEFASSPDESATWSSCQDGNTAVPTEGTWYVRYKETKELYASDAVEVYVISVDRAVADYVAQQNIPESIVAITDAVILNKKNDNDIKGTSFSAIQARAEKTTKKTIKLKWNKMSAADGYEIYGAACNTKKKKNQYKLIKTITNHKKLNYTQKKLKKGTYYKYIVRAYKEIEGKKISVAVSKTIHATTTGGKYGNAKSIKIKSDKSLKKKKGTYTLTVKKNKKYTLRASEARQSKKISKHRAISYETSNNKIATVSKKGVVKGKKKGTCYIYVYAQNGVYKKIKVKIK